MPSGSRLPSLTITLRSEPSGFAENTWPLLALRKNKRAVLAFALAFLTSHLEALTVMIFFPPYSFLLRLWQGRYGRKLQFASIPLYEGGEARYRSAQNQVLNLEGALGLVERFHQ